MSSRIETLGDKASTVSEDAAPLAAWIEMPLVQSFGSKLAFGFGAFSIPSLIRKVGIMDVILPQIG
jgi:hypothetical protein